MYVNMKLCLITKLVQITFFCDSRHIGTCSEDRILYIWTSLIYTNDC